MTCATFQQALELLRKDIPVKIEPGRTAQCVGDRFRKLDGVRSREDSCVMPAELIS